MPCDGSYMDANDMEINISKVYGLLDELKTGKLPKNFGDGYDKRVYNKGYRQDHLDKKTAELCGKLQKLSDKKIKSLSLEMQIWWRDHQKADKERLKKEMKLKKEKSEKEKALKKLTSYEKKLLGLK